MASTNLAQINTVRGLLDKMKPQLAAALPKHLDPDRLLRVAMTAIQTNPRLLECDQRSLFAAVMTAAQLGLEPDGILGSGYLVPFKRKVQFIPGYKGYLQLARNSGEVVTVQAHEVCKGDEFRYAYGLQEELHHVVLSEERTWSNVTHFYSYASFKDGGHIFEVLTRAQVETIRNNAEGWKAFKSGAIKSSPWDPEQPSSIQMGRKTAIRRLANYLPLSVQRAAALDAAYDAGQHATTDEYGDVITGEAIDVTDAEDTQEPKGNGSKQKLDQVAGEESTQEPAPLPKKRGRPKKAKEPEQAEPADQNASPFTAAELVEKIMSAKTEAEVDEQVDLARELPEDKAANVLQMAETKKRQLQKAAGNGGLFKDDA